MVFRVDRLIYVYIALCFCMLAFNIIYTARTKWADRIREKKVVLYMAMLSEMLQETTAPGKKELRKWKRRLKRASGLEIFFEASSRVCAEENGSQRFEKWLEINRDLFVSIGDRYLRRNTLNRAFYAYIVWHFGLCRGAKKDVSVRRMLTTVTEHSIYCRENALCALYSSGEPSVVVKAYVQLSRRGILHSSKLVTDGLLIFEGSKDELAEALWESWDMFNAHYKTAFVNFMRIASGNFRRRFIPLLKDVNEDREVRFAIIRYYRKYYYEDAEEILQSMAAEWQKEDWEYAALASLALEKYPGTKSIDALRGALQSRTWYVRENAAETLLELAGEEKSREYLNMETDRYAKDMLRYKLERKRGIS